MARLTRTQKYADLRNQLENGQETEIKSESLNKFEDKLNVLNIDSINEKTEETKITTIDNVNEKKELTNNKDVLDGLNDDYIPFDFELEDTVENDNSDILKTEEVVVVDDTPITINDNESLFKDLTTTTVDVKVNENENLNEDQTINNQFLEECLSEVDQYNKDKGLITADEILSEIRGNNTEEILKEELVNEEELNADEELSNTVTLEIKKILSELDLNNSLDVQSTDNVAEVESDLTTEDSSVQVQTEPIITSGEELPKEVSDLLKQYISSNEVEETPSVELEKTMLVNNVAEVKEEILDVTSNTELLNETMPLEVGDTVIANSKKLISEDEEDDEVGPNRILNFILITLIIVLIGILGFIGYLILVAQGII